MNLAVIGVGYVGLVAGTCFAESGNDVTCVDIDQKKLDVLNAGKVPIYEPGLEEMVRRNFADQRLIFTSDLPSAVKKSQVIFIAVGTPQGPNGHADLQYVEATARGIARAMDSFKIVVTKSTVPVGTAARVEQRIAAAYQPSAGKRFRFAVASNPEFLREGSAVEDFMRPNRVVIGAESDEAIAILRDLYRPLYLIEVPLVVTNIATAELIKYASNAFLATKISFINEIANLCERVGGDVHVVARAMGLDARIAPKFLHAGPGYGGSCFPKDTRALVAFGRSVGVEQRIVTAVVEVNDRQRELMLAKIEGAVGELSGKRIAMLGLSYKPNTDDVRESPAIDIARKLQQRGAQLRCYDPQAMRNAQRELADVEYCKDAYHAAEGCDALVLATEWNEFRRLDLERLRGTLAEPVIIDLRNVYEPQTMAEAGFRYRAVGR
jgi:UDPglucose 6-dehydrogenase